MNYQKAEKSNLISKRNYLQIANKTDKASFPFKRLLKYSQNFFTSRLLNKFRFGKRRQKGLKREMNSFTRDNQILKYRNEKIANFLLEFGKSFGMLFEKKTLLKNIELYDQLFKNRPISDLTGGMGYNKGLILYILFCHYQPRVSIESGVWRGFTTYLIDNAIFEDSKLYCFDIDLSRNEFFSKKATYYENDITLFSELDLSKVDIAFFDDHISIYERLKLCIENKIGIVILDDDLGLTQVHTDGNPPIPTASMIFNYEEIPKKFEWVFNGITYRADISNLSVDEIKKFYKYIPFPSLKEYTGYDNYSFASLLLKK